MNMKEHILAALREQLARWEDLLSGLREGQITSPHFDLNWSIKDVVAHLWGWQQISVARVDAAALNRDPRYPSWIERFPEDWEANADQVNAVFYGLCHEKPWPEVYRDWREGFLHLLDSGDRIPEIDLLNGDRYPWLHGYSAADILIASYDHHQEHLDKLTGWLQEYSS